MYIYRHTNTLANLLAENFWCCKRVELSSCYEFTLDHKWNDSIRGNCCYAAQPLATTPVAWAELYKIDFKYGLC